MHKDTILQLFDFDADIENIEHLAIEIAKKVVDKTPYSMILYNCSKGTNLSTESKKCKWFSIVLKEITKREKKKSEV